MLCFLVSQIVWTKCNEKHKTKRGNSSVLVFPGVGTLSGLRGRWLFLSWFCRGATFHKYVHVVRVVTVELASRVPGNVRVESLYVLLLLVASRVDIRSMENGLSEFSFCFLNGSKFTAVKRVVYVTKILREFMYTVRRTAQVVIQIAIFGRQRRYRLRVRRV